MPDADARLAPLVPFVAGDEYIILQAPSFKLGRHAFSSPS